MAHKLYTFASIFTHVISWSVRSGHRFVCSVLFFGLNWYIHVVLRTESHSIVLRSGSRIHRINASSNSGILFANIIARLACVSVYSTRNANVFTSFIAKMKKSNKKKQRKHRVIDCCNRLFCALDTTRHCFFSLLLRIYLFICCAVVVLMARILLLLSIWVQDKSDESLFYDWRHAMYESQRAQWNTPT